MKHRKNSQSAATLQMKKWQIALEMPLCQQTEAGSICRHVGLFDDADAVDTVKTAELCDRDGIRSAVKIHHGICDVTA